jgi:MFS family permease
VLGGPLARREQLAPVTVASGLLMGVAIALVAFFMSLGPIVMLLAVAGAGGAVQVVAGRTLLQRTSDDRVLARVFGVEEGASLLALALGASLAPVFVDAYGTGPAFVPFGVGATLFTLSALVVLRRLDTRTVPRRAEIELMRRVSFLEALRPYELERLARAARWIEAGAGRDVVAQGDPGDRFYLVAEGRLGVRVNGVQRPHVLGAGDSFGEIALLHRVPRTATVTTLTAVRLLALDAADFLGTVTGHPDVERLAADVAQAHLSRDRLLPG